MPDARDLVRWRRDLHRIPECDFDVAETLAYVRHKLEALDGACELWEPSRSALCALFRRGGGTGATCVRAELDALPVTERTGLPWASRHEGRMHACGHDAHMAIALGLAADLAAGRVAGGRDVLLVFEPAEETTGGAREVVASGALARARCDRAVAVHLWPGLPLGAVATRAGALLASSCEVDVDVRGRAAHIGRASEGADALACACDLRAEASSRVAGLRDPEGRPPLLGFGRMEAGQVRNQVAASARLEGSLRAFDERTRDEARRTLREAGEECAARHGCEVEVAFSEGYPPLLCDAGLVRAAREALPELLELGEPLQITDDFSWYCREVPGIFLLLGCGEDAAPLHSDAFDFDESLLVRGLEAVERLVALP